MDNSKNGLMTNVWGPTGWHFLHCVTFGYPQDPDSFNEENEQEPGTVQDDYYNFFMHVGYVLPCRYCRESYQEYVKELPPDVTSRDTLTRWLWTIHNKVSDKIGEKYSGASFDEIKNKYESYRAVCSKDMIARGCTVPLFGRKMRTSVFVYSQEVVNIVSILFFVNLIFMLTRKNK